MADGYISQIKLPNKETYDFRDRNLKVYTGTCTTEAATVIKDVTTDGEFTLTKGAVVFVYFIITNTAAVANLKLRINSTAEDDAKPIKHQYNASESNLPGVGYIRANQTYIFYYDGDNWVMITDYNTDSNDAAGYIREWQNGAYVKPTTVLYRYQLLLPVGDGEHVIPVNTTSNRTATDKDTITTAAFNICGYIEYYSTTSTIQADGNIDGRYHWMMRSDINLSYSFNTGSTLTPYENVYIVATLVSPTTATLRNPGATGNDASAQATGANAGPITQTLPTEEDSYIYIKLGRAYSASNIILTLDHPIYWFKDGELRLYTEGRGIKSITRSGTTFTVTRDDGSTFDFTQQDTNKYHKTGSWGGTNNLTYTATAVNSADALAFTLATASTSAYGVTKLSSATDSDSEVLAATPKAIKTLNIKMDGLLAAANAMVFKGVINATNALPATHNTGDTYRVGTAGTYPIIDSNGRYCEVGTLIICVTDGTAANAAHWTAVETNEDGAVIGPSSSTDNAIARFDRATGRIIQDSKVTINDNGCLTLTHIAGKSEELSIKYGSTIDYWWGVGTGNTSHGMYDVKADKWIISAGADNKWNFDGNADTATTATQLSFKNGRVASADLDISTMHSRMLLTLASSSMTTNKPPMGDGYIVTYGWDNAYWGAQQAISHSKTPHMAIRGTNGDTTNDWGSWIYLLDANNYTDYATKTDGSNASGTWGISITGSAGSVAWANTGHPSTFPPTIGTTSTTAAAGDHTHTISLTQTGTSTVNLAAGTVYTLTAGGSSVVFKTPADGNTDTKVNVTATAAAITKNYLLMTSTAPTSSATGHTALGSASLWVNAVDKGKFELVLGNATATTTAGGQFGQLALYSASTAGTYLKAADGTAWKTQTLQAKDGTIALTSDIPTNLNQLTNGPGYTTNTGTVTSVKLIQGAGITVSSSGTAITTTGERTISITGMDTTNGSTTKWLNQKGGWSIPSASDVGALSSSTTVTNVAISADITTNKDYAVVFGTTPSDGTQPTGAKTEGLQKNISKFYFNPYEGNLNATSFSVNESVTLKYNTTDKSLEFIF